MFSLTNKPDMAARLYGNLVKLASDPVRGTDVMKVIQMIAGVMVEASLVFEYPDEALRSALDRLCFSLKSRPLDGPLGPQVLPPAHILDSETERGRGAARMFFEEWLDCNFEFHALFNVIVHNAIVSWEGEGQPRAESLRLLVECAQRAMAFEVSAQELCDMVIELKVPQGWTLADCVASLSAVAGRRLALSLNSESCAIFRGADLPENLDKIVYVMTQEAVRLGVPPGRDWRFGLAANDVPADAPHELIEEIDPHCRHFFKVIRLPSLYDQAVSCAKAAGRMLAVASGGEIPEMEPAIAKPLAMAAITETYKSVCMTHQIASY